MEALDKKQQIMQVAEGIFSSTGYEGCSVREICKAANINVAMIHYYFGSKEGLFEALVQNKVLFFKDKLSDWASDKTLTPWQKIERIIESYVNRFYDHRGFHLTLMREISLSQRGNMHHKISEILVGNAQFIKQIIKQGVQKKQFKNVDVEMTIASLLGTINQTMISEELCRKLCNKPENFEPYTNTDFRKRLIKHLKNMMQAHLAL